MADEKRNLSGYIETYAVRLAGGEVILAENKDAEERYMVCDCSWANPLSMNEYSNGIVSSDYLEIMREFTSRLSERCRLLETERAERSIPLQTLTVADCEPIDGVDLENRVVVIKSDSLSAEYRSIDHQLMLCTGGNGARPKSLGRGVFCQNLYDGKSARWERHNIEGVLSDGNLPEWARRKLAELQNPVDLQNPDDIKSAADSQKPAVLQDSDESTITTDNEIQNPNPKPASNTEPLDKEQFWELIDKARETTGHWQDMCRPLIVSLISFEASDIARFKLIYEEYNEHAYKDKLWAAAAIIHNYCSDDGFVDFRGWLIAQGKEVYMNALADPDSLADTEAIKNFAVEVGITKHVPKDGYFYIPYYYDIIHAAGDAYNIKMGKSADIYDALPNYALSETEKAEIAAEIHFAADIDEKMGGLGVSQEETAAAVKRLCPKLFERFAGIESREHAPATDVVVDASKANEKVSVIEEINKDRQSRKTAKQPATQREERSAKQPEQKPKNTNKKRKSEPSL